MATATRYPEAVIPPPTKVILELYIDEAQALYDVSRLVTGDRNFSRRKYFSDHPDSFENVLRPFVQTDRQLGVKDVEYTTVGRICFMSGKER